MIDLPWIYSIDAKLLLVNAFMDAAETFHKWKENM